MARFSMKEFCKLTNVDGAQTALPTESQTLKHNGAQTALPTESQTLKHNEAQRQPSLLKAKR